MASGIGENIGGSQREERLDVLDQCMTERGIDKGRVRLVLRSAALRHSPHAGFGLGFVRTLAYVTGLANVRGAIPFPRTPGSARLGRSWMISGSGQISSEERMQARRSFSSNGLLR